MLVTCIWGCGRVVCTCMCVQMLFSRLFKVDEAGSTPARAHQHIESVNLASQSPEYTTGILQILVFVSAANNERWLYVLERALES